MVDFNAFLNIEKSQHFPNGRVFNFVNVIFYMLNDRINDARFMLKKRRKITAGNITVLVDCGGEDGPSIFFKPFRVICPAPKKGNAKRRAADYHAVTSAFSKILRLSLILVDLSVSSQAFCPNFSFNNCKNAGLV